METNIHLFIISRSFLLRMRNVSDKLCRETRKNAFYVQQVFSENLAVYEIMWKNISEPGRPKIAISRIRIAFWIAKVTNTHSEYVIPIAFLPQH